MLKLCFYEGFIEMLQHLQDQLDGEDNLPSSSAGEGMLVDLLENEVSYCSLTIIYYP